MLELNSFESLVILTIKNNVSDLFGWTLIISDYLRTQTSGSKYAWFQIHKFSLYLQSINTLLLELNSHETLLILTVTNNARDLFWWTRIISDCLRTWISGSKFV